MARWAGRIPAVRATASLASSAGSHPRWISPSSESNHIDRQRSQSSLPSCELDSDELGSRSTSALDADRDLYELATGHKGVEQRVEAGGLFPLQRVTRALNDDHLLQPQLCNGGGGGLYVAQP